MNISDLNKTLGRDKLNIPVRLCKFLSPFARLSLAVAPSFILYQGYE